MTANAAAHAHGPYKSVGWWVLLKFELSIEDFRLLTTEIIRDCLALNPLNKVRIVHSAESIRIDGQGKFRNFERAPALAHCSCVDQGARHTGVTEIGWAA